MLQQRLGGDAAQLASVLAAASPGRAPSLWQELPEVAAAGHLPPLLLVAGQADSKFLGVGQKLVSELTPSSASLNGSTGQVQLVQVPGCGHAVHVERPVELLAVLQQFSDDLAKCQQQDVAA
jgi:isochorismate synthase/2-succinyl-5-enolpyruvyl-6-hydroxy-3-cyclohexene-1-carboxylate synthase/2-succinyl-6-hydroxy-2,4-cyclohexadiene-1-carboxylate synthase/O-succinylbenzoate synthase